MLSEDLGYSSRKNSDVAIVSNSYLSQDSGTNSTVVTVTSVEYEEEESTMVSRNYHHMRDRVVS